ncbi:MAG: hypothetical protein JOZ41_12610 [Chloroflexi bacterium]|nr:hypothetical protein [Chloroflexota bacterium]
MDGGILDPVPADIARALGADVVLGVRLGGVSQHGAVPLTAIHGPAGGRSPHLVDIMMRSFDTMAAGITARVVEDADVTVVADVPPIGLREFARGRAFVPAGHAALQQAWTQLTTVLPWLRGTSLQPPSY